MSNPGPVRAAKAISLNGAGDQVARSANDSDVSRRSPVPSDADHVDLRRARAIRRERDLGAVGRPRRRESIAGLLVSRRTPEPSRFIT